MKGRFRRFCVGIAGAGGLGSNAAMALARSGIGRLIIVDHDRVEESNLNRQYYFMDQIGIFKVEALEHNIRRAVPDCDVVVRVIELEKGSMAEPFKGCHVVLEALDDASIKISFIEEMMLACTDIPVVAASGVAGIGGSARIRERREGNLYLVEDPCAPSSGEAPMISARVGHFAHHQANIVMEILEDMAGR